eukprot:403354638
MESIKTLFKDELESLDAFEKNVQDYGFSYIENFFQEIKLKFQRIFDLHRQNHKDVELSKLFSQLSELMDKENVTFETINFRLEKLQFAITSQLSCNHWGSSLKQRMSSSNFCIIDLKTLRIIKLSSVYLDKVPQKMKFEPCKQNSVVGNQYQNQNFWNSDQNFSKHSSQDEFNIAKPFAQAQSSSKISKQIDFFQKISLEGQEEFEDLLKFENDEFIQRIKFEQDVKLPTSILQSSEETKTEFQIIQQFGPCIKKTFWVFENDSVLKSIKSQSDGSNPIFFTKQPNQDVQFGYRVWNLQGIDKKKVLILKAAQVKFAHLNFVEIDGQGFQYLTTDINKQIENSYQAFLETKRDKSVEFSDDMQEMFEILNIQTNQGRILKRFEVIQEPTILLRPQPQLKWMVTTANIDSTLKYNFENSCADVFTCAYQQMLSEKRNITKYFAFDKQTTYSINLSYSNSFTSGVIMSVPPPQESYSIDLIKSYINLSQIPNYFDYITTFDQLSPSNTQKLTITQQQNKSNFICLINEKDAEFLYIQKLFLESFNKNVVVVAQQQQQIQQPRVKVIKIEKIFNKSLYERFVNEIKFMMKKNPEREFEDILKHLFHGSRNVEPSLIYDSSIGFDFRLSGDGCLYGRGAYFAKDSGYSDTYKYRIPNSSQYQMFVALVLTGESITMKSHDTNLKAPPCKPGSKTERYDSVHNGFQDHYIVYEHYRAYPGYLITYESI